MPTTHRRIAVTRDPELADALERTRGVLDPVDTRSEAGHLRRLALLGARSLRDSDAFEMSDSERRIRSIPGVRLATRDINDLPWLDGQEIDETRSASRAMEWVRRDFDER